MLNHWLGVDTGGTFTDFVYYDGESIRIHKVLSSPAAPERAILQGIEEMQISTRNLHVIHGSTVATNAVLESKGVSTVYVTNCGFADVLSIGRQARRELYNLMPEPRAPFIPKSHCLEINTRLSAEGELLQDLQAKDLARLLEQIRLLSPKAVAVNLLFSFLDNTQEQAIKQAIEVAAQNDAALPDFVCVSSDVLPEYKEYERGMATALNAYVGPLMQGYLQRLSNELTTLASRHATEASVSTGHLSVLQSSGGTIDANNAGQHAVSLLLSGPAGGLKGAAHIAALANERRLLSFDMGGTSTDVALIDGEIQLTAEATIADYPVAVPMVDMHTIGAGGGSIAYVDAGGLLNVGPESAGASPGPACYAQGGARPTVTDANLLLGRLQANAFLGKGMQLDVAAAERAMQRVAKPLGISVEEAALGVVRIANEHMVRALRKISLERGFDPEDFVLTCFGGAGGLHVCALADAMQMKKALVPVHGGVLSALGMLVAEPARELSHSLIQNLQTVDIQQLESLFQQLEQQGIADMQSELSAAPRLQRSVDLRYQGQSFTLNIPWDGIDQLEASFHALHQQTYGHALQIPVELVNLRLSLKGEAPPFKLPKIEAGRERQSLPVDYVRCFAMNTKVPVFQREQLFAGQLIKGPALILETVSTTLVGQNWECELDEWGNIRIQKLIEHSRPL